MKPPKGPSLKQVARAYRKAHTTPKVNHEGARYFNEGANPYAIGSTQKRLTYKPKAKSITVGGTRSGKGATIRKRGVA